MRYLSLRNFSIFEWNNHSQHLNDRSTIKSVETASARWWCLSYSRAERLDFSFTIHRCKLGLVQSTSKTPPQYISLLSIYMLIMREILWSDPDFWGPVDFGPTRTHFDFSDTVSSIKSAVLNQDLWDTYPPSMTTIMIWTFPAWLKFSELKKSVLTSLKAAAVYVVYPKSGIPSTAEAKSLWSWCANFTNVRIYGCLSSLVRIRSQFKMLVYVSAIQVFMALTLFTKIFIVDSSIEINYAIKAMNFDVYSWKNRSSIRWDVRSSLASPYKNIGAATRDWCKCSEASRKASLRRLFYMNFRDLQPSISPYITKSFPNPVMLILTTDF